MEVDLIELSRKEQVIAVSLLNVIDDEIYIDWEYSLISSRGVEWISEICDMIQAEIKNKFSENSIFPLEGLESAAKQIITKNNIFSEEIFQNIIRKFRKEKNVSAVDDNLCFGKITKQNKIVLAFKESFPEGLAMYKQQEELVKCLKNVDNNTFQDSSPRSIAARLESHPDILLWRRGFYIHKDNVAYDIDIVKQIAKWINIYFEKGYSRFQIDIPFNKFKEDLHNCGIPNQYALYTLLRLLNDNRIGQKKFPTIFDLEAEIQSNESIMEELENYFLNANSAVPYSKVRDEFINKRGWKDYSLQQNLTTYSKVIYPWQNRTYIHIDYLSINYKKLQELIDIICNKLKTINGAYSLKGAKSEFNILWEQACTSATVRTMIKLIRSIDSEDLQIDRYFIREVETSNEYISGIAEIEEFCMEKRNEISKFELQKEFGENRGWSENQFYTAMQKANLFKSGKNTYLHQSAINWNEALSQKVHEVLEKYLIERNKNEIPYMQIEELIYEYVLPELQNNIQWTKQLLKSVGEELGEFLFFDDAYMFIDNDFDIEDLDDIIGVLILEKSK